MSNVKKTPARSPRSSAPARKPGSKSPKHRGYRPAEGSGAPAKKRWNADDRARRTETTSKDRRPDWQPDAGAARADRSKRPGRAGDANRSSRPERGSHPVRDGRADRTGRPTRFGAADSGRQRPARNDRFDREAGGARPQRHERPRRESGFYPSKDREERFTAHEDVVLERLEADAIQASDVEGVTFADLGLGSNIVRELAALGAQTPFPIQAATIPDVLKRRDVLGRGKTGSGKTIAFGAPMVERLLDPSGRSQSDPSGQGHLRKDRKPGRKPRALILAPTRELALQIDRTIQPIARSVGLFTTQIYGGVPQHRQVTALQRGVDIVIGTPGRIEDLIEQGRLDLSEVTITVIDEADHMCDLGFLEPVQRILHETRTGGQKLLFSATLDKGVASLVDEFLVDPSVHEVAGEDQASSTIDHRVLLIEQRDKRAIIEQLASGEGKTLIFSRTRAFAEELADDLADAGIPAVSLHGDLNQARRTRNLERLTSGRVNVLVATDVAARGIHVDDISLVIQADPPDEYKSYLHRAGRTGRAGKAGTVVTLVNRRRRRKMDELLGRAEITPRFDEVRPGDALIGTLAAL